MSAEPSPAPLLEICQLCAGYGDSDVLRGIDLKVEAGEIVAVLGSNGVGKSTLNRTISGIVRARSGAIRFDGVAIDREKPAVIVKRGLIQVPEGRRIFTNLSVSENLDLGSYRRAAERRGVNRDRVFAIFPRLFERRAQRATEGPSGGPPIEERDDLDEFGPMPELDALEAMEPVGHPQPPGQAQREEAQALNDK